MRTATFLYRCHSDAASLSGGNWMAGDVALANIQNDRYDRVARSVTASPADTQIRVTLDRQLALAGFAVALPNATVLARVRLTAHEDDGFDNAIFSSGWLTGGQAGADWRDDERSPIISQVLSAQVASRHWLVEIDDSANLLGYVDVARLFLAGGLSPSFNYSYDGNSLSFIDNSLKSHTLSGDMIVWRKVNPREWQCSFSYLPETEMYGSGYEFFRYVGFDREVFIIPDPDDTAFQQERRFFARLKQANPLTQMPVERGGFGFGVLERVARRGVLTPPQLIANARLSASAKLIASHRRTRTRSVAFAAAGMLSARPETGNSRSASFTASGSLSASGLRQVIRTVAFAASASLTASGGRVYLASVDLAATGSVSADAGRIASREAILAASSAVTAMPVRVRHRSVTFAAKGTLVVLGDQQRSVHLAATASLSVVPARIAVRAVAMQAHGGLTASGGRVQTAAAHISATGTLSAATRKVIHRSVAMSAAATMSAVRGRGFSSGFGAGFR